jgi:hypothetical protein
MQAALAKLKAGEDPNALLLDFKDLQKAVGFPEYYDTVDKYPY